MTVTDEMLFASAERARDLWLSTLPDESELPPFRCSKRFERKMGRLIREQRRSKRANQILYFARQTVAAVLAVAVLTFGGMMTVEAYREKVIEVVKQVFTEFTQYYFSSDAPGDEMIELPEMTLEYVPEGMKKVDDHVSSQNLRYMLYENENGGFFEVTQWPIVAEHAYSRKMDTEDSVITMGTINGYEAMFNEKKGHTTIIWTIENIIYEVFGNLGTDEIKRIAEEIKFS